MVFRGELAGRRAILSIKDASVSLAIGRDWVAAWDSGGRLYSLWKDGGLFRRGLNGSVLRKWMEPKALPQALSAVPRRARLGDEESDAVVQEAADAMRRAYADLKRNPLGWTSREGRHPDQAAARLVERCAGFDAGSARVDATQFARIFRPVGILPPDQYLSIVLQATEGCSFGTCTFCDLYHDGYRVKAAAEFRQHAEQVRDFLGDSARLRSRSIFLGSANALAVPTPRVLEFLETTRAVFGAAPSVHAFVDGFTGARKSPAEYMRLRESGLRRVYVGLESGHDPLLAFVRKPASRDLAVEAVRAIKAGGLQAGVIVMIGLGGKLFEAGHVRDTVSAVNAMGLGPGDFLYFSDLVEVPGTSYPALAASSDVVPLSAGERSRQIDAIRAGLVFGGPPPSLARYHVEEFVY